MIKKSSILLERFSDEWPKDEENAFTLDYDADKIAADTTAAIVKIEGEQDADKKTGLAGLLQQNINEITDYAKWEEIHKMTHHSAQLLR